MQHRCCQIIHSKNTTKYSGSSQNTCFEINRYYIIRHHPPCTTPVDKSVKFIKYYFSLIFLNLIICCGLYLSFLLQVQQNPFNSSRCCTFIWVHVHSLPGSITANLHQLYSLLHDHLNPHPLPTCYKNNKPPSTTCDVACSFESQSPPILVQVQQTPINYNHCCMIIWVPIPSLPAKRTTSPHQL